MSSTNPFNPSFGRVPPIFLSRDEQLSAVANGIKAPNSPFQTTLVYGQRGVGKTAFLADVCRSFSDDSSWIVVNLPPSGNLLQGLAQQIVSKSPADLRKVLESLDGISVSVFGLQFGYDRRDLLGTDYQTVLERLLQRLKDKGISVLVAIDEVTASEDIRLFASVYQILMRENLPIALIMTGLPKNVSELQNDKVLTFLLRSARVMLPPLDLVSVKISYKRTFEHGGRIVDEDTLDCMARATQGYAYAFQLLGHLLWETGAETITQDTFDEILDDYREQLYRNAYAKIYEVLSPMDQQFLLAMAHEAQPAIAMSAVAERTGKPSNYLSNYRRRLIDDEVIQPAGYGSVRFTLPFFADYVLDRERLY